MRSHIPSLLNKLAEIIGQKPIRREIISGGYSNQVVKFSCAGGKSFIVKSDAKEPTRFPEEARGLKELRRGPLRLPEVLYADSDMLVLEFIESGPANHASFGDFGSGFAELHRQSNRSFGFSDDNFIGASPQQNQPVKQFVQGSHTWAHFFYEYRLEAQLKLAVAKGIATSELKSKIAMLAKQVTELIGPDLEPPSLLHGDLWSGNFLIDTSGRACLIDPAIYYGNREADLALCHLFGGFPDTFFRAYNDAWPLQQGWEERQPVYQLYHLLNHFNIFGGRSYYTQIIDLFDKKLNFM